MRTPLLLLLGLLIGAVGAWMFQTSFPPEAGTPEERVAELERKLIQTEVRLKAAEERNPAAGLDTRGKLREGARSIMEDLRAGREVDMNDIYKAAKPAMRDLSPIFERLQRKDLRKQQEFLHADLTRKYKLNPQQQEALRKWQQQKVEKDLAEFRAFHENENATLEDMMKADRRHRPREGLDDFMEQNLQGEELAKYRSDRMTERVNQVQGEADRRVSRLHSVVELDDAQQDQVFAVMARSSPEFDPAMQFEGLSGETTPLTAGQSRDEAIMEVLRPEQRQRYEEHRIQRRTEAQKEFTDMGIRLPANWDMFGDD